MDSFFAYLKKSLVFTLLLVFSFVFTYIPQVHNQPPEAEAAGIPVIDKLNLAASVKAIALSFGESMKNFTLDGIAFAIGKAMLSQIIRDTINWINRGFQGKPAFVTDLRRSLLNAADLAAGEYLRELGGITSFICSPFRLDIQAAVALNYQRARELRPQQCRLTDMINNVEEFFDFNSNRWNWNDFLVIVAQPVENSPYGQALQAQIQFNTRLANAQGQVLTETSWNKGFLSSKKCEMEEQPDGEPPIEVCKIVTPGSVIAESVNKSLGAGQDGLIAADEINELIGALMAQLGKQALNGARGLLGLSDSGSAGGGFGNASFANGLAIEGNNAVSQAIDSPSTNSLSSATLNESLSVHQDAVDISIDYVALLSTKALDPDLSETQLQTVRAAISSAASTRDDAILLIPRIEDIKQKFDTLETERINPGTTSDRQLAIIQEQSQLNSELISYAPLTRESLTDLVNSWEDALNN